MLQGLVSFLKQWVLEITWGNSWVTIAAKVAVAVTGVIFLLSATDTVSISALGEGRSESDRNFLWWEPAMGTLTLVVLTSVWVVVAFGIACIRFKRFRVDKELEFDAYRLYYRLPVRNIGWIKVEGHAWAVAIADAHGRRFAAQLPLELDWMHHRNGNKPMLARNVPNKVDVCKIASERGAMDDGTAWSSVVHFTGSNDINLLVGIIAPGKDKLWIAVSIEDCEHERWFSIEPGDSPFRLKVIAEPPPFLAGQPGALLLVGERIKKVAAALLGLVLSVWGKFQNPKKPEQPPTA